MSTEHKQGFCKQCNQLRAVSRPGTNHLLHLVLSVITAGLWILVWIAVSIKMGGWRCDSCGGTAISRVS